MTPPPGKFCCFIKFPPAFFRGKKPFFRKWGFKINVTNLYNSECVVVVILKLHPLTWASLFRGRNEMSNSKTARFSRFLSGGRANAVGTVDGILPWAGLPLALGTQHTPRPRDHPDSAPALANTMRGPRREWLVGRPQILYVRLYEYRKKRWKRVLIFLVVWLWQLPQLRVSTTILNL